MRQSLKSVLPMALILALIALFTSLGVWQIQRLGWKRDLIARVEARLAAPPREAPGPDEWAMLTRSADEYRRVIVTGRFRHADETLVKAVTGLGGGYWAITPLETVQGTYLINRGFVPADRRDPLTWAEGQRDDTVTITGLLRMSEPGGGFLRRNDPAHDRWFSRDVVAISQRLGIETAPFFIDADATPNPGGLPVGGLTVIAFRNAHLSYGLTWFALALGLAGAAFYVFRGQIRKRPA